MGCVYVGCVYVLRGVSEAWNSRRPLLVPCMAQSIRTTATPTVAIRKMIAKGRFLFMRCSFALGCGQCGTNVPAVSSIIAVRRRGALMARNSATLEQSHRPARR
jgi:hypothetical protein